MGLRSLIIGGDGLIGAHLRHALEANNGTVYATTRRKNTNDIYFDLSISEPRNIKFPAVDTVFICAGMTGFKDCQDNVRLAQKVNVDAPREIAEQFSHAKAHIIYLSSSAVFDCNQPKMQHDLCKLPKSIYGKTKSEGEDLILKVGEGMSVLRLTKVVHNNLLIFKKWTESLRDEKNIQAFIDLYFCPIMIEDVIKALIAIAERGIGGVYQVSGESDISYYDAALTLANTLMVNPSLVSPCRATESGILAENILRYTSLDTSSLPDELNFIPPKPIDVLKKVYEKLI